MGTNIGGGGGKKGGRAEPGQVSQLKSLNGVNVPSGVI